MTISTLEFQPDAERYYAQGYWQDGDLWSDFDARSREHAARVALVLEDRSVTYAELRRAAVALSHRLADAGVGAGGGGGPPRRPLNQAPGRPARGLPPGGGLPPRP